MGGTEISIFGDFFGTFESSPADVTIMGQPCIVLHQNETEISCLTPPQPAELPLIFSGKFELNRLYMIHVAPLLEWKIFMFQDLEVFLLRNGLANLLAAI